MEEKVIKIIIDKTQADTSIKSVKKEVTETNEVTKGLTGTLDQMSGGAITAFKSLRAGLTTAIGGFNSLKVAIIGTGIGALIIAILAVKEAFTSSEEGQNKFAKIMGVIGSITGNLSDLLSDLGMKIIEVFENPKKAITDFANLIKDNIVNRFNGLLELIPELGRAITLLFKGEFTKAGEVAANASAKVALGVDNIVQKTKEATQSTKDFIAELQREARIASQIADNRAKADKLDRGLIVERSVADRNRAELLEKAQQRGVFTIKERTKFLQDASKIDEDITNKEIKSAKLRFNAIVEENKLSKSNKEALDAEANAKAKIIDLETARLRKQKLVTSQITGLIEQEAAANKTAFDARKKILDDEEKIKIDKANLEAKNETDRLSKIEQIQNAFKIKNEALEDEQQIEKLERQFERDLIELERLEATELQKFELKKYYTKLIADEQKKIIDDFNKEENQIELNKEDARLKDALDRINLEDKVAEAKKNILNQGFALLVDLAGRGSAIGKGIAVTQATISGIEGVQNAFTTAQKSPITALFPAYPLIQAGIAGAFSAVQVKNILSTRQGGTGGGAGASTGGGNQVAPPSFNLVQGTNSNQIAQSLNAQNQTPTRAYVVGSDVTSQQSLDRNKVNIGSI